MTTKRKLKIIRVPISDCIYITSRTLGRLFLSAWIKSQRKASTSNGFAKGGVIYEQGPEMVIGSGSKLSWMKDFKILTK